MYYLPPLPIQLLSNKNTYIKSTYGYNLPVIRGRRIFNLENYRILFLKTFFCMLLYNVCTQ